MAIPKIMGILNVTPDSFSDGGRHATLERAVVHAKRMVEQGADIIDIGGESTRPGAETIPVEEELRRTVPAVRAIRAAFADADEEPVLSIDTRKPDVAKACIHAGCDVWNDVTALTYAPDSLDVAAELGCDLVIMHSQGTPETMQDRPSYTDAVAEIRDYLASRIDACDAAGIVPAQITIDPGIGFGKRLEDNLAILAHVRSFADLAPTLIGASRKSFIGKLDGSQVDARLGGSLASAVIAAQGGAGIVRVHDVAATKQALIVAEAVAGKLPRPRP